MRRAPLLPSVSCGADSRRRIAGRGLGTPRHPGSRSRGLRRAEGSLLLLLMSLLTPSIFAQEEPLAEDKQFLTFERKLRASSKAVNRYQIPGELYSMKEAQASRYFATYFATNTYNYPLFANLNYPVFHWGENHRNLQAALSRTFLDDLADFFEANPEPASVNTAIVSEPRLEHHYFYMLSFFVKLLGSGRIGREALDRTRQDLTALSRKAPFLLNLAAPVSVRDLPYVNAIRAQYVMAVFSYHKKLGLLKELGAAVPLDGLRGQLYRDYHVILLDNCYFDEKQMGNVHGLLSKLPEHLRYALVITCHDSLAGKHKRIPIHNFACHGRFNVFGNRVGAARGNQFPRGYPWVVTDGFTIVLAHEYGHNVDGCAVRNTPALKAFKGRVMKMAGRKTGNYCRNMFGGSFFLKNPQEFFASLCNQYFCSSLELYRYAMIRYHKGNANHINQFVLLASTFSDEEHCYAYRVTGSGEIKLEKWPITKSHGLIETLTIGDTTTRFTYENGVITSVSKHTPAPPDAGHAGELALYVPEPAKWSVGVIAPGEPILSDRAYAFTVVPGELQGAKYILRACGKPGTKATSEWDAWAWGLKEKWVRVSRPCTCYLAVLSARRREVWLSDSGIEAFAKGQWRRVAEPLATTTPAKSDWRWDVFKRRVETAGYVRFPDIAGLDGKTLFVFAFR